MMSSDTERKCRKDGAEKLRQSIRSLRAAGDHGTVSKLELILARIDQKRQIDNVAAGLT